MMRLALHRIPQLIHQVIDEKDFQFDGWVVDLNWQVVCNIMAERTHSGVIVGLNEFTDEIWITIDIHSRSGLGSISEE